MEPIGLEDPAKILDEQFRYSSRSDDDETAVGRLNGRPWLPEGEESNYIEITLPSPYDINTIITQGFDNGYVSRFYVMYLQKGASDNWQKVTEPDSDRTEVSLWPIKILVY